MTMVRLFHICLCIAALSHLSGCGGTNKPQTAAVTGRVTLDGKPMPNLGVMFQPVTNSALGKNTVFASAGHTDSDGRFTLRFVNDNSNGAVVGEHFVTISEPAPDSDRDLSFKEEMELRKKKPLFPKAWTDQSQRRTVEEGTNDFEFELTSPEKASARTAAVKG